MVWTSCYQATNEVDARLVGELLEREAIPCRVQPLGASVFPWLGFEVCVPEDRLAEALPLVETFERDIAHPTSSWRCPHCGETVDAELAACWSCGGSLDGGPSKPADRDSFPSGVAEGPPKLAVLRTLRLAIRLVVAHPTLFAATIPLFLWKAIALSLDLPQSSDEAMTIQQLVTELPAALLFDPLAAGLAISFAAQASRGRASWTRSVRHLVRKLPRLLALYAVLAGLGAVILLVSPHVPRTTALHGILVPFALLLGWLGVRLALVQVALVVDDVGILGAIERSWALTAGNAWRVFGLLLVTSLLVPFPLSWFWPSARFALQTLLSPVLDSVLVLTHRELAAASSSSGPVTAPLQLPDPSPA